MYLKEDLTMKFSGMLMAFFLHLNSAARNCTKVAEDMFQGQTYNFSLLQTSGILLINNLIPKIA